MVRIDDDHALYLGDGRFESVGGERQNRSHRPVPSGSGERGLDERSLFFDLGERRARGQLTVDENMVVLHRDAPAPVLCLDREDACGPGDDVIDMNAPGDEIVEHMIRTGKVLEDAGDLLLAACALEEALDMAQSLVEAPGKSEDGNRYVTLYAHLASRYVKVGDYVAKGQEIGYMGTTGFSTGVHLHFEIIKNGVQINAMNYYPELAGKAVYYSYGRWISFPFSNMAKYQR